MKKPTIKDLKIHPATECFWLMDDELAALAADIEAHGQRDPIVLGRVNGEKTESIVDGRNRWNARGRVGVPPLFETRKFKEDDEVRAFVRSRAERRNITKAQMAMGVALLYPEDGGKGRRGQKDQDPPKDGRFGRERLRQARIVARHAPDLALAVHDGVRKLDEVLRDIKKEQQALQSDEIKLVTLRKEAPDFACLVDEDRLKLDEAAAALEKQLAQEREQREATLRVTTNAPDAVAAFDSQTFCDAVKKIIADPVARSEFTNRLGGDLDLEKLERGLVKLTKYLSELQPASAAPAPAAPPAPPPQPRDGRRHVDDANDGLAIPLFLRRAGEAAR
jgi:ParB/Sulfiredoxin domain